MYNCKSSRIFNSNFQNWHFSDNHNKYNSVFWCTLQIFLIFSKIHVFRHIFATSSYWVKNNQIVTMVSNVWLLFNTDLIFKFLPKYLFENICWKLTIYNQQIQHHQTGGVLDCFYTPESTTTTTTTATTSTKTTTKSTLKLNYYS